MLPSRRSTERSPDSWSASAHLPVLLVLALCLPELGMACPGDPEPPRSTCGDGVRDGSERCDGADLRGTTCESLRLGTGTLACATDCTFDTSGCEEGCGNGRVDFGEECDGDDLQGGTCQSVGFQDGDLTCGDHCELDQSGCRGGCGDRLLDPGEDCDGELLRSNSCALLGHGSGVPGCNQATCSFNFYPCDECGNGWRGHLEECDGDFPVSCWTVGLGGGDMPCNADCTLDRSVCTGCGNGRREPELHESCDGDDLDGKTCASFGGVGDALGCDDACDFDTSGCLLVCGNDVGELLEECDGEDLRGWTCEALGFAGGGPLRCGGWAGPCHFDTSDCREAPLCFGGEECDNGFDDDCNGEIDDGCSCEPGTTERCYPGPGATRNVGACLDGIQACGADVWEACAAAVVPEDEVCNGKDDDCNGRIDDVDGACADHRLVCPAVEDAAVFDTYVLDVANLIDGATSSCAWTVECPFGGVCPEPADPAACSTTLPLLRAGDYEISVTFDDDQGDARDCSWVLHVTGAGLRVELTWDGGESDDVDLHLHRDAATAWFGDDDCHWANCAASNYLVDWGYAMTAVDDCPPEPPGGQWNYAARGGCPNPRLDLDDTAGQGPENISVDAPAVGDVFHVAVHFFRDDVVVGADTTVRIYCGGDLSAQFGPAAMTNRGANDGDFWRVADVQWTGGDVPCLVTSNALDDGSWDIRDDDTRNAL